MLAIKNSVHLVFYLLTVCCLFACTSEKNQTKVPVETEQAQPATKVNKNDFASDFPREGEMTVGQTKIEYGHLQGRKLVTPDKNLLQDLVDQIRDGDSKNIYFRICVNKDGTTGYVEINETETDVTDKETLKQALKLASTFLVIPDLHGPDQHCGFVKLNINKVVIK